MIETVENCNIDDLEELSESILNEWDYIYVESGFKDSDINILNPCKLEFEKSVELNINILENEFNEHSYKIEEHDYCESDELYYDTKIKQEDSGNRISILIYNDKYMRIYPVDNSVPTINELTKILTCLCLGCNSKFKMDSLSYATKNVNKS